RHAYVTNGNNDDIVVIDLATLTASPTHIDLGSGSGPIGMAITPDSKKAYVATASEITVVDLTTNMVTSTIPIGGGGSPVNVVINLYGDTAYVASWVSDDVTVIDVATDSVVGSPIPVGGSPQGLAIVGNGTKLYVANSDDDNVSVIDLTASPMTV